MKKILFLICICLFTISQNNYSQTKIPELVQEKLNNYKQNNYPEKVYIQTDKPFYALGDPIWFTSYLVNGVNHLKTEKSRILHIELINPKDSLVAKRTLYVNDISLAGDFIIDNSWIPGNYLLRGYTNYMNNQGVKDFFQKKIPIYSVKKEDTITKNSVTQENITVNTSQKPLLLFYPEGGYLVDNISTKVAFKIKNLNLENDFKAILKDQFGQEVTTLKTIEFGLGSFLLKPETGKNYHVSVYINGKEENYPLPKTLKEGLVLTINNNKNNIVINAKSNTKNGLTNSYLVAHQRGKILFNKLEKTNKNSYIISIPSESLTNGMVNITLFNSNGHPVAERAVFIYNSKDKVDLNITTDKTTYATRKKVIVNLNISEIQKTLTPTTLSMSVRDLKAYPHSTRSSNIKTYLLLNSDLRGKVEDPNYFFEKENDPKRNYILDLVMMTNGWKRFTWQELLSDKTKIQEHQPENGIYISGTIKKLKKPYTYHQAPVRLTFLGEFFDQKPTIMTDSLGHFKFGPYGFMDSIPVLLESRLDRFYNKDPKSRNVAIMLDAPKTIPQIIKDSSYTTTFENHLNKKENFVKVTQYIQQIKFEYDQQVQKLKTVELKAKIKTEQDKRATDMDQMTNYGPVGLGGSKRLDVTELKGITSYSAYNLLMRLSGVYLSQGSVFLTRSQSQPKILLDGMEVDADFLRSVEGSYISFIDLLIGADTNLVSSGGANGVIALYSKSGKENSHYKRKPGIINFNAVGFYTAREFAAPDHINGFDEINKTDVRTTLHWEPIIKTIPEKQTQISFFTSDLKSDYIIEIEGISTKGQPIHAIKTFNVE